MCALHTLHSTLHTSHSSFHTLHPTLHTPHFKHHTPHFTPHTPHFTRYTPHFTHLTPHFTLYSPHFSLYSPHSTLYTPHFTFAFDSGSPYLRFLHMICIRVRWFLLFFPAFPVSFRSGVCLDSLCRFCSPLAIASIPGRSNGSPLPGSPLRSSAVVQKWFD